MAYSNWGAFIWKNDENITKECADVSCQIIDGKFDFGNWYEDLIVKTNAGEPMNPIQGHAVINLGDYCLTFYKVYNPILYYLDGSKKELDFENKWKISLKKEGIKIDRLELGDKNNLYMYKIDYKGDKYCVIVGMSVGKGFESTPFSKYFLKNVTLFTREDGKTFYTIKTKREVDIDTIVNKLDRLEDIRHERYWRNRYIKDFIKNILTFRFKHVSWCLDEILDRNEMIKWLK